VQQQIRIQIHRLTRKRRCYPGHDPERWRMAKSAAYGVKERGSSGHRLTCLLLVAAVDTVESPLRDSPERQRPSGLFFTKSPVACHP
jgi:hypothetical protein